MNQPSYQKTADTHSRVLSDEWIDFTGRRRRKRRNKAHIQSPTIGIAHQISNRINTSPSSISRSIAKKMIEMHPLLIEECSKEESDFAGKKSRKAKRQERRQNRKDKRADRKAKKQEAKQERKLIKAQSKAYKREAKGDKKRAVGEANVILAHQGINARAQMASGILGGMAKVAGAVGGSVVGAQAVKALPAILNSGDQNNGYEQDIAGSIAPPTLMGQIAGLAPHALGALGAKMNTSDPMDYQPDLQAMANNVNAGRMNLSDDQEDEEKDKSKNNMLIFGGIGAAVLIVIILLVMMKK